MFIYLALFLIIVTFSFISFSKFYLKISLLMLFIISAFRSEYVDRDHFNYINLIYNAAADLFFPIEPSFKIVSWLSINFFGCYQLVFIVFAMISISLKYKFIERNSPYLMLSVLVFYSNIFVLHDMTQIRAGVACAIVLYALKYLQNKQYITYIAYVFIAATFHITALLFLMVVIFDNKSLSVKYICIYFTFMIVAYISYYLNINILSLLKYINISYVQNKYNDYISQSQGSDFLPINIFSVVQILHLLMVSISFIAARRLHLTNEQIVIIKIYSLSPLALILFAPLPVFSLRISELFSIVEIILLPLLVLLCRQKNLAKTLLIGICFCMFYINIYHLGILKSYSFFGL